MDVKRLNLGCGQDYREGWDNWDVSPHVKTDKQLDIGLGLFPANSEVYDEIYCSGVLEQLLTNQELLNVMNECHRILKNNGSMTVIVPNAKTAMAFKDPHDVRQFTEATFRYFDNTFPEWKHYGKVYGYKSWKIQTIFTSPAGIITVVMQKSLWNPDES